MKKIKHIAIATTLSLLLVLNLYSMNLNAEETTSTYQQNTRQAGRTAEQLQKQEHQTITLKTSRTAHTNANALKDAKYYSANAHMSYKGIYNQLKYEGYTSSQAQYAVNHVGANWNTNAKLAAKDYAFANMSKLGLKDQLLYEGFTNTQAQYGVDNCGANWKANALATAKIYKETPFYMNATELNSQLIYEKFTSSETQYAVDTLFPEIWSNTGSINKYVTGKSHGKNATYIEDFKQTQKSNKGRTRTIRVDYKKGTYDTYGHTKTWENWDYDKNGKFTQKAVTKYSYIAGKEREINFTKLKYSKPGNSSSEIHTAYKNTKYFSNGRVKSTSTYSYYSNSNQASKNVWNEFYSNGKKKDCKDTYYYTNGKQKSINQNLYYQTDGKKDKHIWNSFYSNGKMKTAQDHYYYSNGSTVNEMHMNTYNSKGQKTKNVLNIFYSNGKKKLCQDKYYYSNGKTKSIVKNTYNSKGDRSSHYTKNY